MESHKKSEDRAAAWIARRDSGEWTSADEAGLTQWLESSTANRVAFLRLESAWEEARRLKALGAGMRPREVPPVGGWRHTHFFSSRPAAEPSEGLVQPVESVDLSRQFEPKRIRWRFAAAAASVLLATGIGSYALLHGRDGDRYSTPIGGIASVPLNDGSNITLNTDSDIRVHLTPTERRVDLGQGEGFFVVAKDPGRPFVVHAGNKTVTAIGTQFSVWRDGDDVRVVVTEGTVSVGATKEKLTHRTLSRPHYADSDVLASGSTMPEVARLPAGGIAHITDGDILIESASVPKAEELLTWREGYLTFHETTLAEAAEEFNRYNPHKIMIYDPEVAALRISGTFRPASYDAFVRLLEEGFSIHSKTTDESTVLTRN